VAARQQQYNVVIASFLGWTIDAFDFFLLIFVMADIAKEFGSTVKVVSWAITLTLALRVVGALLFGRLADRYGRKPILMLNILLFSVLECASGFAPTLTVFLVLRALFGIAMGGEWGIGRASPWSPFRLTGADSCLDSCNPVIPSVISWLRWPSGWDSVRWAGAVCS